MLLLSMGISGSQNGGTVPYKAIFCGDIPLHRPYIGLIYGRYLHFRILKFPLILLAFPQQQNFAIGSLAQISSGAIRCSFNTRFRTRFRRVLVQIPREVPEGSGADTSWGSGGFRWRYLLRLRRVLCASGGFRCRYLVRFRRVPGQIPCEVPEGSGAEAEKILGEVPESSGADTLWGSGRFWCRCFVKFQRIPMFLWHKRQIFIA